MTSCDDLQHAIILLEAQRAELGDAAVDASIAAVHQTLTTELPASQPERRKPATVLFADLQDFAKLAELRAPEDVREIQQAFFTTVTAPITDLGGTLELTSQRLRQTDE